MKKTIFTILFIFSACILRADEHSEGVLKKMAEAFDGKTYRIEFVSTMPGEFDRLPGTLIVSKEKYFLDVYDSKVYFDGKTGYTYSETNEEVILENPDPDDLRIFANPARIFQIYERDFSSAYKGNTTLDGKNVSIIELEPRQKNTGYNTLTIYVEAQSGMPVKMTYRLDEYKQDLQLEVKKIAFNIAVTEDTFRFDTKKYPEVEVIDFR